MIWNDDLLFLHVPKTGGMSLTKFLLEHLAAPVHFTNRQRNDEPERAIFHEGRRHGPLPDAKKKLAELGRDLADFDVILAAMRNPYDLEISRYHYLRHGHEWTRGRAQDLALEGDFTKYLREAGFFNDQPPRFHRYYVIGGQMPPNLRVLRFGHLADDLREHAGPYLDTVPDERTFPRINTSKHEDYWQYYDEESEALCYERHRWFFDEGWFERRSDFVPSPVDG